MRALFNYLWTITVVLSSLSLGLFTRHCAAQDQPIRMLFLGDSLTAGYGILQDVAYPGLIAEKARAAGIPVEIVNAGMSGDTSAGGKRRLTWLLKQQPDILFLALGANDGLRGLPVPELKKNLLDIISTTRSAAPSVQIILAGIEIPMNFGAEYTAEFRTVFQNVAKETGVTFIPFLLQGVATVPELNLPDGLHPNEAGHQKIAAHVWPVIERVLRKQQ